MTLQMPLPFFEELSTYELITSQALQSAWDWLLSEIEERPPSPGEICFFDNNCWNDASQLELISCNLATLYIASQLGDHREIILMANGETAPSVIWITGPLDNDVKAVVTNARRFRNHLSEHLAFWIRLAVERVSRGINNQNTQAEFSYSKPNMQPEDKGADGLYLEFMPTCRVEIQSVKNSLTNPKPLIASTNFRKKGKSTPKKLLDDFWRLRHGNDGLARLDDQLAHLLSPIQPNIQQKIRFGLIQSGSYNAVVVTDTKFAKEELFEGYSFVTDDINKRFATYIGSNDWKTLAYSTFESVQRILKQYGLNK